MRAGDGSITVLVGSQCVGTIRLDLTSRGRAGRRHEIHSAQGHRYALVDDVSLDDGGPQAIVAAAGEKAERDDQPQDDGSGPLHGEIAPEVWRRSVRDADGLTTVAGGQSL